MIVWPQREDVLCIRHEVQYMYACFKKMIVWPQGEDVMHTS